LWEEKELKTVYGRDVQTVQMERRSPRWRSVPQAAGQLTPHTWVASFSPLNCLICTETHSPTKMQPTENFFPFFGPTPVSSSWIPSGLWICWNGVNSEMLKEVSKKTENQIEMKPKSAFLGLETYP